MRTRIALAVAVPVAIITVSSITPTASAQSVRSTPARFQKAEEPVVAVHRLKPAASPSNHSQTDLQMLGVSLPFEQGSASLLRASSVGPVVAFHKAVPRSGAKVHGTTVHVRTSENTIVHSAAVDTSGSTPPAVVTAPVATAVVTPPPPATPVPAGPVDTVTPDERAGWEQVAMCEEGGDWEYDGGSYSGGLGISRTNWDAYGGLEYAPEGAEATEDEQIMVAERIQSTPPDQDGCSGW
jgi:hypothetical protein